jgi:serine/threonine-protein kinase
MRLTLSKVALYLAPLLLVLPVRAQTITTVAGNTTWNVPISVRLDAAGNLYAPDYYNHVVYKVDSSGNTTIVAGTYGKGGFAGDGALATSALLDNPSGAVPAPDGTLYITDYTAHRIRKVAPNGIITTYAGTGTGNFKGDGGPAGSAEIRSPSDILIDASGNILFADYGNARVRKITPAGIISTVAGFGTATYSGDGSSALQAGISPSALGLGTGGSFYIVDSGTDFAYGGQRVRMVAANGIITTVAGNGTDADSGDGGQATSASLGGPSGVALDSGGNLYISENHTEHIRKVSPDGTITT